MRLRPLDPRRLRRWAERGDSLSLERVDHPRDERRFGSDDDEIDPFVASRGDDPVDVIGADVEAPGIIGDAGVSWRTKGLRGGSRAAQGADDRVLAAAAADD